MLIALHDDLRRGPGGRPGAARRPAAAGPRRSSTRSRRGRVDRALVPESIARKILLLDDPNLAAAVRGLWGDLGGATTEQMRQADRAARGDRSPTGSGNPYNGQGALSARAAASATPSSTKAATSAPNLTSYQRGDLRSMLLAVVNPSAEVREGYETYLALMADGRIATGFLVDQDDRIVVLRGADGHNQLLPRDEIEEMKPRPAVGHARRPARPADRAAGPRPVRLPAEHAAPE